MMHFDGKTSIGLKYIEDETGTTFLGYKSDGAHLFLTCPIF